MTRTIWAYGDETGDRGLSPTASPIFGMALVVGDAAAMTELRDTVRRLRVDFKVPAGQVMSWKSHLKNADRRNHAVRTLAALEKHQVIYAVTKKSELAGGSFQSDDKRFYDFVAGSAHKSILWASRNLRADEVRIRFGRVRGVDHEHTRKYIHSVNIPDPKVPTYLEKELSWVGADTHFESEAADLYAGFLKAAFWPDEFGNTEEIYIRRIWHQIRKGPTGCAVPLGLFTMPHYGVIFNESWFSCESCPSKVKYDGQDPTIWDVLNLRK